MAPLHEYRADEILLVRIKVKKCDRKYLIALLDVLSRHHEVRCQYKKAFLSIKTFEVKAEGKDEEQFIREIQSFCSQVGWRTEVAR